MYYSFCGEWQLFLKSGNNQESLGGITVPFARESRISGINRTLKKGDRFIYKKQFLLSENFRDKRAILHFGAVDQISEVYINDKFVCKNEGRSLSFKADITPFICGAKNTVTVVVQDNLDKTYGYRYYESVREFEATILSLYRDEVIPIINRGLCATVLTQISDVEDETNRLVT